MLDILSWRLYALKAWPPTRLLARDQATSYPVFGWRSCMRYPAAEERNEILLFILHVLRSLSYICRKVARSSSGTIFSCELVTGLIT